MFLHFQEYAAEMDSGGEEEKGRRDLASSSGRVAAFNEVQMSLSWQRRAACAGGERGGGVATL